MNFLSCASMFNKLCIVVVISGFLMIDGAKVMLSLQTCKDFLKKNGAFVEGAIQKNIMILIRCVIRIG